MHCKLNTSWKAKGGITNEHKANELNLLWEPNASHYKKKKKNSIHHKQNQKGIMNIRQQKLSCINSCLLKQRDIIYLLKISFCCLHTEAASSGLRENLKWDSNHFIMAKHGIFNTLAHRAKTKTRHYNQNKANKTKFVMKNKNGTLQSKIRGNKLCYH